MEILQMKNTSVHTNGNDEEQDNENRSSPSHNSVKGVCPMQIK